MKPVSWSFYWKTFSYVTLGFVFLVGVYGGVLMLRTLWPGLHEDAALYSTVIISHAAGDGARFAVYLPALLQDNGSRIFNSHGQLYYPIVAAFLSKPNFENLLFCLHAFNLMGLLMGFFVFAHTAYYSIHKSWLICLVFGIAGSFASVGVLHYLQGRPEHGIPLVAFLFIIIKIIWKKNELPEWVEGLQIGIIIAISPVPGALFGLLSCACLAFRATDEKKFIKTCFERFFYALISWLTLTYVVCGTNPFGQFGNAKNWAEMYIYNPHSFRTFWIDIPYVPFAIMPFGVAGFVFFFLSVNFLQSDKSNVLKATFIFICVLSFYPIWKHLIAWSETNYTLLPFMPLVTIWSIQKIDFVFRNKSCLNFSSKAAICLLVLFCLTGPALGYLRTAAVQPKVVKSGFTYSNSFDSIKKLREALKPKEAIMIDGWNNSRSAIVLDAYPLTFFANAWPATMDDSEKILGIKVEYFLVLQEFRMEPPVRSGFKLIEEKFNKNKCTVFGIKIFDFVPGYGFALYSREKPSTKTY